MFNFFSSIKEIHVCKLGSGLELNQSSKFGASLSLTEDDCINHLPDGFQCTLPDGSSWSVKSNQWLQLKGGKKAGGESW